MTPDPESTLFDFAASNRVPTNEEEKTVSELHAALGTAGVPLRLRRPPVVAPKPNWQRYMYAAVTVALVLAVAAASFLALQHQSTTPPPTEVPEVVLGLASPDSGSATSVAGAVCDLTGDVPIFTAANESPIDAPSVLVNLDGDMKLICNGEETLLAQDVRMAIGTQTPHVVQAMSGEGVLLLNIASGESLLIPHDHDAAQQTISISSWGQWIMLPSSDDNTLASLYNLETFAEIPVATNDTRVDLASVSRMAISADMETVAIAITSTDDSEAHILDGFFIVGEDNSSRFVPASVEGEPRQLAISLDGEAIAVRSFEGSGFQGTNTLALITTADGVTVDSWEAGEYDAMIDLTWLNDGSALLFTDNDALYRVTSLQPEPEAIFTGDQVNGLVLTADDNVIAISHVDSSEPGPAQPKTTIINLETGDEKTLDGRDMWAGSSPLATKRTTLILGIPQEVTSGYLQMDYVAVNAVTGETLGELDYTDPGTDGFHHSSWGTDGNITVLAFSPSSMWKLIDENSNPALEQIPPPPLDDETMQGVAFVISPEGFMSLRTFDPYSAWLMLPGTDEWIPVDLAAPGESQGVNPSISFIPGAD